MRVSLRAVVLASAALGLGAGVAAAQPVGPVCAHVVGGTINETVQAFATPSGGSNFLISGKVFDGSVPLVGSGFVSGTAFTFVAMGHASAGAAAGSLRVYEGVIGTNTGTGSGRCFNSDSSSECGTSTNVNYTVVACP